jgi:hypothetical protein
MMVLVLGLTAVGLVALVGVTPSLGLLDGIPLAGVAAGAWHFVRRHLRLP